MLHIKYQGSCLGPVVSDKIFSCFPYIISLYKTCDQGVGPILASGHNLNKLGKDSLDDATYPLSRLKALWFQTRRFLKVSSWKSILNHFFNNYRRGPYKDHSCQVWSKPNKICPDDAQRTTDNRYSTFTIAHLEPYRQLTIKHDMPSLATELYLL